MHRSGPIYRILAFSAASGDDNPDDGGTTVATPVQKPTTKTASKIDKPWNVVVHNDPVNLMSFVTLVLRQIFGYSKEKAHSLMREIHERGKSIVWTGEREKAEFYVQQLQSFQLQAQLSRD